MTNNTPEYQEQRDDRLFSTIRSSVSINELIHELALDNAGEIHLSPLADLLLRGANYGLTSDEIRECLSTLIDKSEQINSPLSLNLTANNSRMPTELELLAVSV